MKQFQAVYVPVAVPTFHLESARKEFRKSVALLKSIDADFICPDEMLLSIDAMGAYLDGLNPDVIVFQNITFANAAYMCETLRRFRCPIVLWTLREPVIDGGRLRLNSLTGAYSAANALRNFGRDFEYVFGATEEKRVADALIAYVTAAKVRTEMNGMQMAAVGHTPQGFGFGRALDTDLLSCFGVVLQSVEARELIDTAKEFSDESCAEYLTRSEYAMRGLEATPEKNRKDFARLYRAYSEYVQKNQIQALASRCWPDFFTVLGTPVCAVLAMLNDDGVAAACESDTYGALSMWMGMRLSGESVFFGDPVSLNEEENTVCFWHCGMAACSMARCDTGATVGVHPNRNLGPVMDFGCEAFPEATIFRIGRKSDGNFRFFLLSGEAVDKPKQFIGASIVVRTNVPCREAVEKSVLDGMEPHFVVIKGNHIAALTALAKMLDMEVCYYG